MWACAFWPQLYLWVRNWRYIVPLIWLITGIQLFYTGSNIWSTYSMYVCNARRPGTAYEQMNSKLTEVTREIVHLFTSMIMNWWQIITTQRCTLMFQLRSNPQPHAWRRKSLFRCTTCSNMCWCNHSSGRGSILSSFSPASASTQMWTSPEPLWQIVGDACHKLIALVVKWYSKNIFWLGVRAITSQIGPHE